MNVYKVMRVLNILNIEYDEVPLQRFKDENLMEGVEEAEFHGWVDRDKRFVYLTGAGVTLLEEGGL